MSTQMIRTAWQDLLTGQGFTGPASAGLPGQTAARPAGRLRTASARYWLTWPRLSPGLELVTLVAGYAAPSVVRLALPAAKHAAFAHAAELYHAEQRIHLNVEPYLNHLVSSHAVLAMLTGYYYGTLHFILTPLILAWLYLRKRAAFARLRSALVVSTIGANIVFWAWPVAPPRFAVAGLNDLLVTRDILGSADPHGVSSAVNLYAAMPSLHVCWATWCAVAVVTTTRSRWHHLAWLYPAATTFVVLATANHFVFDCIGGLAIAAFGLAATRMRPVRAADVLHPLGAVFQAAPPSADTGTRAASTRVPLRPAALSPARRRSSFASGRCPGRHQDERPPIIHEQQGHRTKVVRNSLCQGGLRRNRRQRRGISVALLHRGQRHLRPRRGLRQGHHVTTAYRWQGRRLGGGFDGQVREDAVQPAGQPPVGAAG